VEIPADGDCLFTATAFQILQELDRLNCPPTLKTHLERLGIQNIEQGNSKYVAQKLRSLVVDEWQSQFADEYMEFFLYTSEVGQDKKNMFMLEAEEFRNAGVSARSLGDCVLLALPNILKLPFMILTTQTMSPFTDICPRSIVAGARPIFLAYESSGPGHYNALVKTEHKSESQPKETMLSKKSTDKANGTRKSRKRARHETQDLTPQKGKDFLSSKGENIKEGPLNVAEVFLMRSIMNNCIVNEKQVGRKEDFQTSVANLFNKVAEFLTGDDVLGKLPIKYHKVNNLKRAARRILKEDDKQDKFGS
jgi:hypothetical protein